MAATLEPRSNSGSTQEFDEPTGPIGHWHQRCDARLLELLDFHCGADDVCPQLAEAMRYGVLAGGKRVRPLLCFLTAHDFGAEPEPLLDFACALELVHSASLMLDDLPCMDDASLRRGRPAAHLRFGDAVTTLAAVGLLNLAFGVVARSEALDIAVRCELVGRLSDAVGTTGLVSGQARDLCERAGDLGPLQMQQINLQKTAVLFELAVTAGALHAGLADRDIQPLRRFARQIGMGFQSADDLLDLIKDSSLTGKDAGLDLAKSGSVHAVGEGVIRERLAQELSEAGRALAELGVRESLLTGYVESLFHRRMA